MTLATNEEWLAQVLLDRGSPEEALERVLEGWGVGGAVEAGAFFLRRACGWAKLAYWPRVSGSPVVARRGMRDSEAALALRRLLSLPGLTDDGRPSPRPRVDGRLGCYSLGGNEEEIARLVVKVRDGWEAADLSFPVFSSLGLYLFGLRDREVGEALALRGDLSRRLITARGTVPSKRVGWRDDFPEVVGRSRAMGEVMALVRRAAPTDASIHISGESGTGKEVIARAIHRFGGRGGRFVSENCAAFSESLLEAEIFGSEKGSYTGADRSRPGLLERSDGGTLFLDEIGEMGPALQSKLLRVLQEREVRRVGGDAMIPVDFRLVTATHRDLQHEVNEGRFREDLLFRIDVIRVPLPPLRERPEDIPLLVEHFVETITKERGLARPVVHEDAVKVMTRHDWPGNIRELRNEIERALALSPEAISTDSLSSRFERPFLPRGMARRVRDELGADIHSLERVVLGGVIQEVLEETGGNKSRAAEILGIPKTNLYRRLQRYGIPAREG